MGFQKEDLKSVLRLGYLDAKNEDELVSQMQGILGHMDRLSRLDLSQVEPYFTRSKNQMPIRKDVVRDVAIDISVNGPVVEENCYRVPRILES